MELKYLEICGILLPLSDQIVSDDNNQDVVARVSELLEQVENTESACVSLGTSAAF